MSKERAVASEDLIERLVMAVADWKSDQRINRKKSHPLASYFSSALAPFIVADRAEAIETVYDWLQNGHDPSDDDHYQATRLIDRLTNPAEDNK